MTVPMLDVSRQNAPLRSEINEAIAEVCDSAAFVHGPACKAFESAVAEYCQVPHALGCASGTDALLLALMALEVGPGDEVILPSFTFFATAGSVWRMGAKPVFADIDPVTFNLDPEDVARRITPATKAIMPVHLFGQAADMTALGELADRHGLFVIEDAAQAIGAEHRGRQVGGIGHVGCFSFYPTKNLGGFGDGGMVTTHDPALAERMTILRDHGQSPRYIHHVVGTNSRLDAIQAAVLNVKLKRLDAYAAARGEHAEYYNERFSEPRTAAAVTAPSVVGPELGGQSTSVWNQYTVRVKAGRREALQQRLSAAGVGCAIYYPKPLHMQQCFEGLGYRAGDLPHTEQAAAEVLSLPVFPELSELERETVVSEVTAFAAGVGTPMPAQRAA
ncbi:Aminotransferase [Pirellulimonas nuda]|uniref:Aminotransferase n=1 Tax=Pirellulimonas nuda TaxID=2528009 RepID=A0A518D5L5_9BACT|nr:DegT/DnrJ/EryC1/StrS family aminotransferase [Pirellulimonas nuda]QDU86763.1 Aminotransferase [Pirellulimonas nuda]